MVRERMIVRARLRAEFGARECGQTKQLEQVGMNIQPPQFLSIIVRNFAYAEGVRCS